MSEEEKLDKINNHLWWLSTFLVKLPLFMSCLYLIVFATKDCNCSETKSYPTVESPKKTESGLGLGDPLGDYGNNSGSVITFYSNHTYHFVTLGVEVGAGTWERPLALGGNQAGQVLLTDEDTGEVEYYTIHPDGYILHSFTGEKFKPTE